MGDVPVPVVQVVDMVTMRDGDVPAAFAMSVRMPFVRGVIAGLALVVVVAMRRMQMAVVHVIHVITVRDRYVPTPLAVYVRVPGVLLMRGGHKASFQCVLRYLVVTIRYIEKRSVICEMTHGWRDSGISGPGNTHAGITRRKRFSVPHGCRLN